MADHPFPSHLPITAFPEVVWSTQYKNWTLKTWIEADLPNHDSVLWKPELHRWECLSPYKEISEVVWSRNNCRWQLLPPALENTLPSKALAYSLYPTHLPGLEGTCAFDASRFRSWKFEPENSYELPISPCHILWNSGERLWNLISEFEKDVKWTWNRKYRTWGLAHAPAPFCFFIRSLSSSYSPSDLPISKITSIEIAQRLCASEPDYDRPESSNNSIFDKFSRLKGAQGSHQFSLSDQPNARNPVKRLVTSLKRHSSPPRERKRKRRRLEKPNPRKLKSKELASPDQDGSGSGSGELSYAESRSSSRSGYRSHHGSHHGSDIALPSPSDSVRSLSRARFLEASVSLDLSSNYLASRSRSSSSVAVGSDEPHRMEPRQNL